MQYIKYFIVLVCIAACQYEPKQPLSRESIAVNQSNIDYAINNSIEVIYPANASNIKHAIIWLHGLGATANDFPPIVPYLELNPDIPIRFIFPQAPNRPITINNGLTMPGWYDIKGVDLASKEDREGVDESKTIVEKLITQQIEQGIPAGNIILAGFSQGGAVAYYTGSRSNQALAGVLALSTYVVFLNETEAEQSGKNKNTPIFATHGTQDGVVPLPLGQLSAEHMQSLGYSVKWKTYPMQHEVSMPQIKDIGAWINDIFKSP